MKKVLIRDDEGHISPFNNMIGEVLLEGSCGDALVYIESVQAILIVHHATLPDDTPQIYRGQEYYWPMHAMSIPDGFDTKHWITMMAMGMK